MAKAVEAFLMWNKPAAIIPRRQGEQDQAALASYEGAKIYARRGDRTAIKALAGTVPAPAKQPDPLSAMTGAKPPVAAPGPSFWARLHDLISRKTKFA